MVSMAGTTEFVKLGQRGLVVDLEEASKKLDVKRDTGLDFSSVRRINSAELQAMERFAGVANEKGIKVVVRGVNVDVYKVLTLMGLTRRFSFVS